MREQNPLHLSSDIHPPRAMSSSVHLRSGLVWTRHLNTAPGDFTEVLYLESAFGAPTRTLHIKKKGHLSQPGTQREDVRGQTLTQPRVGCQNAHRETSLSIILAGGPEEGSYTESARFSPGTFKALRLVRDTYSQKGFLSRIYKECLQLSKENTDNKWIM